MASLTAETQQIITQNHLGEPLEIYGPNTILDIIVGSFLAILGIFLIGFNFYVNGVAPDLLLSIMFQLAGLFCAVSCLWIIFRAIHNRDVRAVVCTDGVAYIRPSGSEGFRWQEVLTTFHKVNVSTSSSESGTTTTTHHTYTVHCHNGRKIVFKSPLTKVQDLGESIEVQVARVKSQGQPHIY